MFRVRPKAELSVLNLSSEYMLRVRPKAELSVRRLIATSPERERARARERECARESESTREMRLRAQERYEREGVSATRVSKSLNQSALDESLSL